MVLNRNNKCGTSEKYINLLIIAVLFAALFVSNVASAVDTGWVVPSSNVGGSGVTNPQNAYASDTSYARFAANGNYWNWYGYVLSSIPAGSTIDGIEVNARGLRQSGCGSNCLMQVRLSYDSGTSWTSYLSTATWSTANSDHILGGPTNNWGRSWTRDEIANTFRVQALWQVASGTYYGDLDYLPVRVYYTPGAGTTYSVSGYVTNASNSAAISGATVSADSNPPESNTTNGAGYYNLLLGNGTYIITASKIGYNSDFISITVNGAPVGNADISLTPAPPSSNTGQIIVATNRYIVLDDPLTSGKTAQTAAGFALPSGTSWSPNAWSSAQTTIKGYALVLDDNGNPITNAPVIFSVRNWDSSDKTTSTAINTDANGIASYSLDMNAKNYYGNWYVEANATALGKTDTTGFIYNWWGCNSGGCRNHGNNDPPSAANPSLQNSPYTLGREGTTSRDNAHETSDNDCVGCHRSYGGTGGGQAFTGQPTKTADVHTTNTCANCHTGITSHSSNQPIKSCSDCHSWTNLSREYTMSNGSTPMSNYSGNAAATGHNPTNAIPCIICHGPMHNITKPDESLRLTKNNIVEDSQCLTCHTSYEKHNGGLGCTLCHSQDAHAIKVFSQTAGYVNKGNTYQGDCTNCHQNTTFLSALINAPKAGSYSGSAPQVQKPLNHGTDRNGTKWGTYWTSTKDACVYCHGDNKHISARLGNAAVPVGSDPIGGVIGSGTVCSSCHNSTDNDYAATMALLIPDPVAYKPGDNWNTSGTDHASYGTTDSACQSCHGGVLSASPDISEFVHNVDVGKAGGPNCVSCHDKGQSQEMVDVGNMSTSVSIHNTLNSEASANNVDNKRCYACHTNSTVSADGVVNEAELPASGHPDSYNIPKKCTQCHSQGNFSALIVSEHNSAGIDIKTKPYANTNDSCVNCHNKTEMIISNSDPGGVKSIFASVSHYGSNKTGVSLYNTGSTSNCTYCHQNPSGTFTTEMVDASWNANINNHTELGTNPGCASCHSSGRIHESTLTKPALTLPDSSYCQTCHSSLSKQKHNGSVDCTDCHLATSKNIHPVQYLQPGGTFKTNSQDNKTSAVNCTDCHQGQGLLNAPIIPEKLNHSTDRNGTKWGTYWTSTKDACIYCHGDIKHNDTRLGNAAVPVGSDPIGGAIGSGTVCSSCHNSTDNDYAATMALLIPDPVAYKPGDNWNTTGTDHASYGTTDSACQSCHGGVLSASPDISEFVHNVDTGKSGGPNCISCHDTSGSAPMIDVAVLQNSIHKALNGALSNTNLACYACHGNGTAPDNGHPLNYKNPKSCDNCHTGAGQYQAPIINNHQPDGSIKTAANCSTCHNNSINKYEFSENASVGHYGSNTTLLKPTVNQTSAPRFGFATGAEALDYNKDCNNCHNPSNTAYGNATLINSAHTSTALCNQCHLVNNANNLHNVSLRIPGSYTCRNCHTNAAIASQFGAPDVTGTGKENLGTCANCHGGGDEIFDSLVDHNMDRTYPSGKGGFTDIVYLNGQQSLTVTKGALVTITSMVNDSSGSASKIAGAEYFINIDPGRSKGIPMNAVDGQYNAVKGKWENVTATIDTSGLESGTYLINVRGVDIGKQWSQVKNATLTIQSLGYINGTVTNASVPISGVYVSTAGASYTTGSDGKYSLMLTEGNYVVKATKHPEFDDYTISDVNVIPSDTTIRDINLIRKPTGTISGVITN